MRTLQNGQALLIVLLSMAVVLTVVLSILSRSVTDIAVTSRGEEAIRAFSAAEAGVEQVLLLGQDAGGQFEGSDFSAESERVGENKSSFVYPQEVSAGDTATIWFVSHDDGGSLICDSTHPCFTGNDIQICFGEPGLTYPDPNVRPAVEVTVLYFNTPGLARSARIGRAAMDSYSGRTVQNGFSAVATVGCTIDGTTFPFSSVINFGNGGLNIPASVRGSPNGLQVATVRFLYNDRLQPFGVTSASGTFPAQATKIVSTGTSGEATRKVEVLRLFADLPPIFQTALFSPVGVTK